MRKTRTPSLWEQEATWCIHFSGLMDKTCRLGIAYDDVKGEGKGIERFPCLKETPADPTRTDLCVGVEYLTEEQAKAKAEETERRIAAMLKKAADGICTTCDRPVERERQVGRCVYASPCGHRLFQGRARPATAGEQGGAS
jgi:hypothetical protein